MAISPTQAVQPRPLAGGPRRRLVMAGGTQAPERARAWLHNVARWLDKEIEQTLALLCLGARQQRRPSRRRRRRRADRAGAAGDRRRGGRRGERSGTRASRRASASARSTSRAAGVSCSSIRWRTAGASPTTAAPTSGSSCAGLSAPPQPTCWPATNMPAGSYCALTASSRSHDLRPEGGRDVPGPIREVERTRRPASMARARSGSGRGGPRPRRRAAGSNTAPTPKTTCSASSFGSAPAFSSSRPSAPPSWRT